MEDGLLSLKWNNHKTTFFEILKVLRDKANYTDATLAVEGKFYPVHKLVLSTCSEYFSEIFERTPCKSPVIVLKDVRSQDLESLLDYMYLGEVNVNQNDLALLLKTAECLRIKGLAVPDDDPTRHSTSSSTSHSKVHSLSAEEIARETPPPKRRKEDSSSTGTGSAVSPPRVSPACSRIPSSPSHTPSTQQPPPSGGKPLDSTPPGEQVVDGAPFVKVEMDEPEDGEENFQSDTNYDSNTEVENRDFTVDKSEHDPATYPNTNFSVASSQQVAEMSWEDGENSFPQEGFGGDSSGQHGGGGLQLLSLLDFSGDEEDSEPFCGISEIKSITPDSLPLPHISPESSQGLLKMGNIRYNCAFCTKPFRSKVDLERHLRTHTGEKPFACFFCPHRSATKGNLKAHIKNIHAEYAAKIASENFLNEGGGLT